HPPPLPPAYFRVNPALVLNADLSRTLLVVRTVHLSGTVTHTVPTRRSSDLCSPNNQGYLAKADVTLVETTQGYRFDLPLLCKDSIVTSYVSTLLTISRLVLTANQDSGQRPLSNLPLASFIVNPALVINADLS